MPTPEFKPFAHEDLAGIRATLLDVQSDAYSDEMSNPFRQRFAWFVDHWGGKPGWSCIVGFDGDVAVGFSYGAPSTSGKEVWRSCWQDAPTGDTSTFFVSELMLRKAWRGQGLGKELHNALMATRAEALSCLTVDVTHPRVQAMYESWDYFKVGEDQPFADSPTYAVMVKRLRDSH